MSKTTVSPSRTRAIGPPRDASGATVEGRGELPIAQRSSPNVYGFPLTGNWFIGAGASFHSHHRWVVPEEFALDIARSRAYILFCALAAALWAAAFVIYVVRFGGVLVQPSLPRMG